MIQVLGCLEAGVFAALGLLHLYWACGGRWGAGVVLPTRGDSLAFEPTPAMTVLVALGLFAAAFVVLSAARLATGLPGSLAELGAWGLAGLFALRSVGDFRYVGFSKRIKDTPFARWDTLLFSPLCLALAGLSGLVAALR